MADVTVMLREMFDRFAPYLDAEETIAAFAKEFPNKCPVCAFARHMRERGHSPQVQPHPCREYRPMEVR